MTMNHIRNIQLSKHRQYQKYTQKFIDVGINEWVYVHEVQVIVLFQQNNINSLW
jgi:hypothetical protein